jgi:hypothetical protein
MRITPVSRAFSREIRCKEVDETVQSFVDSLFGIVSRIIVSA